MALKLTKRKQCMNAIALLIKTGSLHPNTSYDFRLINGRWYVRLWRFGIGNPETGEGVALVEPEELIAALSPPVIQGTSGNI